MKNLQIGTKPHLPRPRALALVPAALLAWTAWAVSMAGCGDDGVGDPVEDHSTYAIESSFDVQSDFGGSGLGDVLNMLRDMSDGKDDPGRFVVDQVIDQLPAPLSWTAEPFAGVLGEKVNAAIYALVPTAADEAKAIAEQFSNAARQFAMSSTLSVGLDDEGRFTGIHELTQVSYALGNDTLKLTAADFGSAIKPAKRIPVDIEGARLMIPSHRLTLPIGTALRRVLEEGVIPRVLPTQNNLASVLVRWFACASVSKVIADTIDGGESTVASACAGGAKSVANSLLDRIQKLDEHGALKLRGDATGSGSDYTGAGWGGSYVIGKDNEAKLDPSKCPFQGTRTSLAQ